MNPWISDIDSSAYFTKHSWFSCLFQYKKKFKYN